MAESRRLLWRVENVLRLVTNYLQSDADECDSKSAEEKFGEILMDENESIAKRMRTCFELKALNTESAIDALNVGLLFSESALLKHEVAYVLGQMRNKYAVKYLVNVLQNEWEETIVRHECLEALGAIADVTDAHTLRLIKSYCDHSIVELAETAQLALQCMEMAANNQRIARSKYNSVDPAPPFDEIEEYKHNLDKLKHIYLSPCNSLFKRYRAMFTLRDIGSNQCVDILCLGLNDKSALFRHEVAFVLGQMMNQHGIKSLQKVLQNESESDMVRHEAAEALGSIAKDECKDIIRDYLNDSQAVVKESCIVANDIYDFWTTTQ